MKTSYTKLNSPRTPPASLDNIFEPRPEQSPQNPQSPSTVEKIMRAIRQFLPQTDSYQNLPESRVQ